MSIETSSRCDAEHLDSQTIMQTMSDEYDALMEVKTGEVNAPTKMTEEKQHAKVEATKVDQNCEGEKATAAGERTKRLLKGA